MMRLRALTRRLGASLAREWSMPTLSPQVRRAFGGRVVLLDWERRRVLAELALPGAMGLAMRDGLIAVGSWIDQCIYILRDGARAGCLTHPWFNYLHGLDLTLHDTYLAASAGSDAIVELDEQGTVLWAWFGPEHGYATCSDGSPAFIDRDADYRHLRRDTAEQAMHVNAALMLPDGTVLATLYHQGQLIAIDRASGHARVALDGLSRPHGIHRRAGGFLLSDSLGHRVVLLDAALNVCGQIAHGAQWLQDAIPTSAGTYLTLENARMDQDPDPSASNRIVEIDARGAPLRCLDAGTDNRLFNVCEVDERHAHALARAWGAVAEPDGWRWE